MTRPSELDWSDPHKTPRAASPGSRQGGGGNPLNVSPARPLTDWFAVACEIVAPTPDQNLAALAEAVRTYRATYGRWAYEALRDAATLCGMPAGAPPLSWAVARLNTYRNMIGA